MLRFWHRATSTFILISQWTGALTIRYDGELEQGLDQDEGADELSAFEVLHANKNTSEPVIPSKLHCELNGYFGNALDAAISCMVYAAAYNLRATVTESSAAIFDMKILDNEYITILDGEPDERDWDPCMMCPPGPNVRYCRGSYIDKKTGLATIVPQKHQWITSCTSFAPPVYTHAEFMKQYRKMAQQIQVRDHPRKSEPCLAVHLRLGMELDWVVYYHEKRFHPNLTKIDEAAQFLRSTLKDLDWVHVAYDDHREQTVEQLKKMRFFNEGRKFGKIGGVSQNTLLADHMALSNCQAILTTAFSSFSWTASAMGNIPYYMMHDASEADKKARSYMADDDHNISFLEIPAFPLK